MSVLLFDVGYAVFELRRELVKMSNADYDLTELVHHYLTYRRTKVLDKRFYEYRGTARDLEDGEILFFYTSQFYRHLDTMLDQIDQPIRNVYLSKDESTLAVELL